MNRLLKRIREGCKDAKHILEIDVLCYSQGAPLCPVHHKPEEGCRLCEIDAEADKVHEGLKGLIQKVTKLLSED